MVPDLVLLSGSVDGLNEGVDIALCVEVVPEGLSVAWVISTCVLLLTTVVDEGDTSCGEGESKRTLEGRDIVVVVEEPSVVVVVNEHT